MLAATFNIKLCPQNMSTFEEIKDKLWQNLLNFQGLPAAAVAKLLQSCMILTP